MVLIVIKIMLLVCWLSFNMDIYNLLVAEFLLRDDPPV